MFVVDIILHFRLQRLKNLATIAYLFFIPIPGVENAI